MKTRMKGFLCAAAAAAMCLCALTGCKASGGGSRGSLRETPASSAEEKHTHEYGDWVTVVEPTCTEPGEEERTCSCGKTIEENDGYGYTKSYLFSVEADNFQSCCMQLIDSGGDM